MPRALGAPASDASPNLMTIPTELRLQISECTLFFPKPLRRDPGADRFLLLQQFGLFDPRKSPDSCAILRVCTQLYTDAKPILYAQNTFIFDQPTSFPPSIAALVRNVTVELLLVQFTKCWYEGIKGWNWYLKRWPFPKGSVKKLTISFPDGGAQQLEEGFAQLKRGVGHGGVVMGGIPHGPYKPYGVDVEEIVIEGVSEEFAAAIKHVAASMR